MVGLRGVGRQTGGFCCWLVFRGRILICSSLRQTHNHLINAKTRVEARFYCMVHGICMLLVHGIGESVIGTGILYL